MIAKNIKLIFKSILIIAGIVIGNVWFGFSQQNTDKISLTVMSFNVRYINTKDGINVWANRKEKVAEVIASNNVDVAGLQEPWKDQIKDLKKLLPEYSWFGWSRDNGKSKGEFCPIFYKKDKFTVLHKGIFWLSKTPDKVGSKGWDVKYPRIVVWGRFKNNKDGKEFYFFNTHLGGQIARFESAKLLRSKIDEMSKGLSVIITGDLNSKPDSKAYETMVSGNYKVEIEDAFHTAEDKNNEQFTDYWFDGENTDLKRIDYIFVTPQIKVLYHEIINKRMGRYYPSDHLAIKAEIEI
ncbi:MAG: endonuclease/exonuclease/phosphatase family protein [Bacteroidetes bacterium]|nr:endonuclease/exonuclease/phosphatase family protein [Bacteroidota bacterium]